MPPILLKLQYTFSQTPLKVILNAYQTKMNERKTNPVGKVAVLSMAADDNKTISYQVRRKVPDFCQRFFNLNDVVYTEKAFIENENTLQITSEQHVSKVTLNTNMRYVYNTNTNDTVVIGIVKLEGVPKILSKPMKIYAEKEFQSERKLDEKYIAAK